MKKASSHDFGIVLKNSQGLYYCGLNKFDNQIRKSQIYHSMKYAEEACRHLNSAESLRRINQDFTLVKVEIKEV